VSTNPILHMQWKTLEFFWTSMQENIITKRKLDCSKVRKKMCLAFSKYQHAKKMCLAFPAICICLNPPSRHKLPLTNMTHLQTKNLPYETWTNKNINTISKLLHEKQQTKKNHLQHNDSNTWVSFHASRDCQPTRVLALSTCQHLFLPFIH